MHWRHAESMEAKSSHEALLAPHIKCGEDASNRPKTEADIITTIELLALAKKTQRIRTASKSSNRAKYPAGQPARL